MREVKEKREGETQHRAVKSLQLIVRFPTSQYENLRDLPFNKKKIN